jgi:BirA family biotin operon repressor/biotin-[acetyl-CoA-carboxylase] ligase
LWIADCGLIKAEIDGEIPLMNDSQIRNPQSAIRDHLPSPWRSLIRFESVDSTQLEAGRRLAAGMAMDGVVLWAERQTAGKGRMTHGWVSEAGGLYVTAGLPYDLPLRMPDTGWISLIAALAAAQALRETLGLDVQIKWPNDLIVAGRKVGGLLGEVKALAGGARMILVGMGINWANRVSLPEGSDASAPPGSLVEFLPELTLEARGRFLLGWLEHWNRWRDRLTGDYDGTLRRLGGAIEEILWRRGEAISLKHTERGPMSGRILGLGAGGAARLETAAGEVCEVNCGWQIESVNWQANRKV